MIFYVLVYFLIYVINILALIYLYKESFKTKITRKTLPHIVYSILKFSELKNLYCALVIAVIGIPVFICLYLLFNIYVVPLRNIDLVVVYMLFILFSVYIVYMMTPIYLETVKFNPRRAVRKKKKISSSKIFIIKCFLFWLYFNVLLLHTVVNIIFILIR